MELTMGMIQCKPYRVKRNGEWVWITPELKKYVSGYEQQRGGKATRIKKTTTNTKRETN